MSGRVHKEPFAQVPEWLLYSEVSSRAVHLFAVLDRHADREGRAFPGKPKLAGALGCSVNSVDRALGELRDAGALTTTPRHRPDGSRSTNDYWLWPATPPVGAAPLVGLPHPTDGVGATPPMGQQEERKPVERESVNETPAADAAPTAAERARTIVREFHEERRAAGQPGVAKFIGACKVVESMLGAGHAADDLTWAVRQAPTISTGALEVALSKRRPQRAAAQPDRAWDRDEESGVLEL